MPTLKTFLPDVNVWLALASRRHVHSAAAAGWLDSVGTGQAAFCRVTQMGLLRLVTNARVMGMDTIGQVEAWQVYDRMMQDSRIRFLSEPAGLEEVWREFTREKHAGTNVWTDAYLQAFAKLRGLCVVSFDRGFQRFGEPQAVILK